MHTVCPRHLAPNDPDLGAPDLALAAVDVRDALAQVEAGILAVVDTLCAVCQSASRVRSSPSLIHHLPWVGG